MNARWLVLCLALVTGCPGPSPFVALAGGFRDEASAASRLGRTMPRRDGTFPGPFRAFVVQGPQAEPIEGNYQNVQQFEASLRGVVRAQLSAQCGLDVTPAAGFDQLRSIEIAWESVLDTTADRWEFTGSGGCCLADGGVRPECNGQAVITAIFKTRVTAHLAQQAGVTASGQFACMDGRTEEIAPSPETTTETPETTTGGGDDPTTNEPTTEPTTPDTPTPETSLTGAELEASDRAEGRVTIDVRVTDEQRLDLSSTGWNVVMVQDAATVCRARRAP